ncbi:hypothetical protein BCY88_16655 [Paraburkholderia fungorum]|uniref:Uncharacterized protein n=1 Tax=Paraburkholderia fungorum TaxID=134537 RepID=A0A420GXE3_9BURK|nr:hypothetical protein BCY88_16655 [Paraburkholderia fungorum]
MVEGRADGAAIEGLRLSAILPDTTTRPALTLRFAPEKRGTTMPVSLRAVPTRKKTGLCAISKDFTIERQVLLLENQLRSSAR